MLPGNRCELCGKQIRGQRAKHKQTKFHRHCARRRKKESDANSESRSYVDRRESSRRFIGMKAYMRKYRRKHPGLSTRYVRKLRFKRRNRESDIQRVGAQPATDYNQVSLAATLPEGATGTSPQCDKYDLFLMDLWASEGNPHSS